MILVEDIRIESNCLSYLRLQSVHTFAPSIDLPAGRSLDHSYGNLLIISIFVLLAIQPKLDYLSLRKITSFAANIRPFPGKQRFFRAHLFSVRHFVFTTAFPGSLSPRPWERGCCFHCKIPDHQGL